MSAWTKTPPSESGFYWIRGCEGFGPAEIVLFDHEMLWIDRIHWRHPTRLSAGYIAEDLDDEFTGEWWPVPIQPPEEKA